MPTVFEKLVKNARYAIASKSVNLAYSAYGAAQMARELKAISREEFLTLSEMLIKDFINNPAARKE